jgi:hypothetical protein
MLWRIGNLAVAAPEDGRTPAELHSASALKMEWQDFVISHFSNPMASEFGGQYPQKLSKNPPFFRDARWRDLTSLDNKQLEIKRQEQLKNSQTVHNQRIIF